MVRVILSLLQNFLSALPLASIKPTRILLQIGAKNYRKHNVSWNVTMPALILGAAYDAAMNMVYALGIYAAVTKHLGDPLDFPSNLNAWEATLCNSSSMLNGYLVECPNRRCEE
ncbi:hypothetical protein K469DRAFT_745247 [Zopfia rhizophila CBS 207.26]|uniref:Uncharacterized protein n=1 Tax=Zopfia rhizophila CBS 207.26 TaxID=1314779 RepID=A0A6A6ESR6_9PEZI|nr:hypothetical protein K469DRAFT_745247 [Zopfia rhizophila CBS 207.26]